jgi:hypothetical protein
MTEVETLMGTHKISSRTAFPGSNFLETTISLKQVKLAQVSFENGCIGIVVPQNMVNEWQINDQVGFEWLVSLDDGNPLSILLEKDFRCLTGRPGEDEVGLYPNPNEAHG